MADPALPDRGALPPLTPQSRRIQAAIAGFGADRVLGAARNPIREFKSIDTARAPVVILKEKHLLSRVAPEARDMDRPAAVEEWMGTCTAQFILRRPAPPSPTPCATAAAWRPTPPPRACRLMWRKEPSSW